MQGAVKLVAKLGRKWSRGASVLILMGVAVGIFAPMTFMVLAFVVPLFQPSDVPDDPSMSHVVSWWKLSSLLWAPLAVEWALPQIGELVAEWKKEDGAPEPKGLADWARELEHGNRRPEFGGTADKQSDRMNG